MLTLNNSIKFIKRIDDFKFQILFELIMERDLYFIMPRPASKVENIFS